MSYSFSYITLVVVLAYFFALYNFVSRIKKVHPELYTKLGEGRVWYSAPEQIRLFAFLFGFRYLKHNDKKLRVLALLTKLLLIAAIYCIFAMPIYFRAST